jgi:hypothetical protein
MSSASSLLRKKRESELDISHGSFASTWTVWRRTPPHGRYTGTPRPALTDGLVIKHGDTCRQATRRESNGSGSH